MLHKQSLLQTNKQLNNNYSRKLAKMETLASVAQHHTARLVIEYTPFSYFNLKVIDTHIKVVRNRNICFYKF